MLSSGEVANLYKPDEFEDVSVGRLSETVLNGALGRSKVKNKLDSAANKAGILHTNEAMYEFLVSRVRANLHIVLCMSPIGDDFRNRLR